MTKAYDVRKTPLHAVSLIFISNAASIFCHYIQFQFVSERDHRIQRHRRRRRRSVAKRIVRCSVLAKSELKSLCWENMLRFILIDKVPSTGCVRTVKSYEFISDFELMQQRRKEVESEIKMVHLISSRVTRTHFEMHFWLFSHSLLAFPSNDMVGMSRSHRGLSSLSLVLMLLLLAPSQKLRSEKHRGSGFAYRVKILQCFRIASHSDNFVNWSNSQAMTSCVCVYAVR